MKQVKSCQNEFQPKANSCRDWQVTAVKELAERKKIINQTNKKPQGQTLFVAGEKCFIGNTWMARYAEALKLNLKPQYPPTP